MGSDNEENHHGSAVQGFGYSGTEEEGLREGELKNTLSLLRS